MRKAWIVTLAMLVLAGPASAAVERVEIDQRTPFAGSLNFGDAGSYEKIRGVAYFALDPNAPANASIVDLKSAPRDPRGLVTFKAEFLMLRPVKAQGSTLVYDVNNRGGIAILGQVDGKSPVDNDPTDARDAGDGFLMRHGFTLLWSAWTWDVAPQAPGSRPLVFAPPVATGPDGAPITGKVENEFTVAAPTVTTTYAGMRGLTYEPAVVDDPAAELTERARPDDPRKPMPRASWRFLPPERSGGPGRVMLDGGFKPGVIYELTYVAKDPYVTGAGLAGIRDLLAYIRAHGIDGGPPPARTLIFGISQSGRVIGRMLHDGLDVDETGKLAFDGAYLEVPGAGGRPGSTAGSPSRPGIRRCWKSTTIPADAFPFTTRPTRDPVTGRPAPPRPRRDARGRLPEDYPGQHLDRILEPRRLVDRTTPDGARDVAPAPNVRLYAFMGAQHYVGALGHAGALHELRLDHRSLSADAGADRRAGPLDRRRRASAAQRLSAHRRRNPGKRWRPIGRPFPGPSAITPPMQNWHEPRLDFGPRFDAEGIADKVPPVHGKPFGTKVPAPDADGNDRGGVRMVELMTPLGTHTGWNERAEETGFAWADRPVRWQLPALRADRGGANSRARPKAQPGGALSQPGRLCRQGEGGGGAARPRPGSCCRRMWRER